jgi:hypothetical protein
MATEMARLNRSSASTRQVTTATPAMLDFRETEISIEGFVNAMSTGSHRSMARVGGGAQGGVAALMLTPWSKGVETGRLDVEDEFDGAPTLTI